MDRRARDPDVTSRPAGWRDLWPVIRMRLVLWLLPIVVLALSGDDDGHDTVGEPLMR